MVLDRSGRVRRRALVADRAAGQAGLLTMSQLRGLGITTAQMHAELDGERWRRAGRYTLAVAPPRPEARADWWLAVLECSPRCAGDEVPRAALAGVTALQAAGLRGVTDDGFIHVAAPKSSRPLPAPPGVRVHETRRWRDDDALTSGIVRARPEVAAVQASLWARTDREASLYLVAAVQQRLTTADAIADVLDRVQRDKRRRLLRTVVHEVRDGAQSLNELDFAVLCRRRGLPEPDRQVVVEHPGGRAYLDVRWRRWRVTVEIDGIGHLRPDRWIDDSLRHNEIALSGDVVLRVPSLGLRIDPDPYLDAVDRALRRAGWRPDDARRPST